MSSAKELIEKVINEAGWLPTIRDEASVLGGRYLKKTKS